MTSNVISSNIIQTDSILHPAIESNVTDADYVVEEHVLVMGGHDYYDLTIALWGNKHDLTVKGTVTGATAVVLGGNPMDGAGNLLTVAEGAHIVGVRSGATLYGDSSLVNEGRIDSGRHGVSFWMEGETHATAVNRGTISAAMCGVFVTFESDVTARLDFTNSGTVRGGNSAYSGGNGVDVVRNTGTMIGDVATGMGADLVDDRGGTIIGTIWLGENDDILRPGASVETANGGTGYDTLTFADTAGITLDLEAKTGTGRAAGDSYTGFEKVIGSATGADRLTGDGNLNIFEGLGGNDTLSGGDGQDILRGGRGADTLRGGIGPDLLDGGLGKDRSSGGAGDDLFVLVQGAANADTITDFHNAAGDDDSFVLRASAFGKEFGSGALASERFVSGPGHQALEADDRFIFCTADTTLWFDADGKGGAAAVMIADLQAGAAVTAADFVLL